ncbi:Malectin-like carbohydrate-binding domain containing protein [Trema orientale]|uniref:Malectin-like carbohydrate-binding domain containing protein n=1 Tax=Trema orientale TaxID=63057 RepID=A0A2P5EFK0_TREOI|nr:Malectin-like carbohydrate-binding domain containing protein [Trema orientale]
MVVTKHLLFAIVQGALCLTILVQAQNQTGFISIDCGTTGSRYTDDKTGITYVSDTDFIESGENREILPAYKAQIDEQQFWNVRSFPEQIRNCYTLKPSQGNETRYLIRARFMYGNYDNKGVGPAFDLHLGADFWDTVKFKDASSTISKEIIHVPSSDHIHVCLVNTGRGTPFISVLELRPLENDTYVSETGSLQLLQRYDFGSTIDQVMRYKDDAYDRLWSPFDTIVWKPLSASLMNDTISENSFNVPSTVMSTASTKNRSIGFMGIHWESLNTSTRYFFYMHFAELEKLRRNEYREFNISINGNLWYGALVPEYLSTITIFSVHGTKPDSEGKITVWFNNTENSTLPPLVNALEVYQLKDTSVQETYQTDADAILKIKSAYEVKRNWQGDPCLPIAYLWDGIGCSYDGNNPPRIISLNLSSSGLKGEISPFIADLTMLQYLDLSNNSLTGTVPEFLAQLSFLRVLNLRGNNLMGPLPDIKGSKDGFTFSVDNNVSRNQTASPPTGETSSSPEYSFKNYNFLIPLIASVGGFLLNFVA